MRKSRIPKRLDIGRYLHYLTAAPDGSRIRSFDPAQVRPVYILRFVCIIAIVTLIPFGILALSENNTSAGIMDLSLAVFLIANYLHAQRYKRYTFNINLGVFLAAVLFVYMFLTMGMNRGGFVWYYAFPVVASFLLGSKKGAIATALISLPMVVFFLMRTPPSIFASYSLDFKLRFIFSFSVVFAFSYLFEYSREKNWGQLQEAHAGLEKRFDERTSALQALQGAIRSLQKEISERRRVEGALRESEERYRTILEDTQEGYFELDLAGNLTFFNDEVCRRLGYPREELIGMNYRQYFADPEAAKQAAQAYNKLYRTGEPIRGLDREVIRKNGTRLIHEVSVSLIRDSEGKPIGFRGTSRDITQRKRMEEALRESEEKYRTILENIEDGYYESDLKGNLTFFNDSVCRIWQYSKEELLGLNNRQYMDQENARKAFQAYHNVYQSGEPGRVCDYEIIRKDGTRRCIEASISLRKDSSGKPIGFRGIVRDVTERRQAEEVLRVKTEELARSNRDLEQFAYVASHDLQEPLRMVTSYVQLLARRYNGKLDSEADEFINFAMDGSIRMRKLINDLLTYSRVKTKGKALEPTDCESVLSQSLDNLKVAIEENGALVTHDSLPTVMADNPQLVELFQNLIGNAIKFRGSEPPRIHVSAGRNGKGWIFSVRDNGIGIAPEYSKRIFIIFQRLHSREKYAGTGIGLAICQKIVERHGGRIWVESEAGKGATFYFTLPASKVEQACS
ncbi:MAG: PAS domain S-box protein [Thermodesulfobacteriota bacterium]